MDSDSVNSSRCSMTDSGSDALESMKRRVKEMEEETNKLKEMQQRIEGENSLQDTNGPATTPNILDELKEREFADKKSIFVENVDYATTTEDLQTHFQSCGVINRITIPCNKHSGHPKGYAYIEFEEEASMFRSMALNGSLLRNRMIKVHGKRTNIPGYSRRARGRGGRGYVRRGSTRGRWYSREA